MKSKLYAILYIASFICISLQSFSQANTSLSNLASATAVNHSLVAGTTNSLSLGSSTIGWHNLYLNNAIYLNGNSIFSMPFKTSVAIGVKALSLNPSVDHLIAIGDSAFFSNTTGARGTAVGSLSLYKNTTGDNNTALGYQTLYSNTIGTSNVASGMQVLYTNTTGNNNVAVGAKAMYANTSGYSNIGVGIKTLYANTTGNHSVAIGDSALYNSTGSDNVAIGSKSLYNNISGTHNTALGYNANISSSSASNATAVGSNAYAACSNCLVLGGVSGTNGASANVNVGIGTANPAAKLHVAGGDEILEGNLNLTSDQKSIQFALPGSTPAPMMYMFPSGTSNTDRMVIAHSPNYTNYGLQYSDLIDQFNFLGNGNNIMSIGLGSGYVGIGTASPSYTLDVESGGTAVYGNSTGGSYGVYGNSTNTGVYGYGNTSGVYGSSAYVGVNGSGTSYGINGSGTADGSYGVAGSGTYIGVYASSSDGNALVGSSTNGEGANIYSTNYYGLVAGTQRTDANYAAVFNGNTYVYGAYQTSDRNLKKNITELGDAMSIINKLKPKTYEFIQEGKYAVMHLPSGEHYGLIAQDLETVLPGLVKNVDYVGPVSAKMADTSASARKASSLAKPAAANEKIITKAVNYIELIPIMIKAMQEQQATIDAQNDKIATLTTLVNQLLKTNGNANALSATSAFLGDASPNPANNTTKIVYGIPSNTTKAELVIHSVSGVKLQQVTLNNSGLININTSGLSAGTYTYTLIANGTVVDTKKMVIAK